MRRVLKIVGIVLGALVGLLIVAIAAVYLITNSRLNQTFDVETVAITVPDDSETIAYGEHVVTIRGCVGCHGDNLAGQALIEDPGFGNIYSANLTTGDGGQISKYDDAHLARAIRHGVDPDGEALLIMPAHEYNGLSDDDTAAIIAYIRAQPPVDHVQQETKIGPLARLFYLVAGLPLVPAELIDHDAPRSAAPTPGVTAEYGEYLAVTCQGCHNVDYSGGPTPGGPPGELPPRNLTPGGNLANWDQAGFVETFRTGVTPDGHTLASDMPWELFSKMSDDELGAVWLYLQQLPALETGEHPEG